MKYRHRERRLLASIFDLLIVLGISILCGFPLHFALISFDYTDNRILSVVASSLISGSLITFGILFYLIILPASHKGQTIGKMIFKLQIVKENGEDPKFFELFLRESLRCIAFICSLGLSLILNLFLALCTKDGQSFQDAYCHLKIVDYGLITRGN